MGLNDSFETRRLDMTHVTRYRYVLHRHISRSLRQQTN
jgi:hypothetical protein